MLFCVRRRRCVAACGGCIFCSALNIVICIILARGRDCVRTCACVLCVSVCNQRFENSMSLVCVCVCVHVCRVRGPRLRCPVCRRKTIIEFKPSVLRVNVDYTVH